MPFGLKNAPSCFQRLMDGILVEMSAHTCVYIDDILVFSRDWNDHLRHIEEVLCALERAGLAANPAKCVWGARSLGYLGHMIGVGHVSVPEARVMALKEYCLPKRKKDLRAFLGTIGYYRRFVPDFAGRAGPLNAALAKDSPDLMKWTDVMYKSFRFFCVIVYVWTPC